MSVSHILDDVKSTRGTNDKKALLDLHKDNDLLKQALKYGLDPFLPFNVVKVPKVKTRLEFPLAEKDSWKEFFTIADECASREITGNAAIDRIYTCFSSVREEDEKWMRRILKKHLAIGASTKTINKVFHNLVPTFDVALAQKFEEKRIVGKRICVEPKLDGIRCFAIVKNREAHLYARSGKLITNFSDTIGADLASMPDGCYDGEIMGKDFIALMRQAYRKENVDTDDTYFALFDYLSFEEWDARESVTSCEIRYIALMHAVVPLGTMKKNSELVRPTRYKYLRVVNRKYEQSNYDKIKVHHDRFVQEGYEGAMIKDLDAPYKFGRGPEVMKLKAFHDADLAVIAFKEGTGRHENKLGSILVNYQGVEVNVGSGFSDEMRDEVWENQEKYLGVVAEVRYQEVTPDGSLRFPTFVCWRFDR